MAEDKLKALRYQALQNETLRNRDFVESDGALYRRSKNADESRFVTGNLIPLQRGDAFWLIEEIERLRAEAEQREAENTALREALKPFAAAGRVLNSKPARGGALSDIVWSINDAAITVSDLQRADYLSNPDATPDTGAPKAAAGDAIKVGDTVRIVKPGSIYRNREGKVIAITGVGVSAVYDIEFSTSQKDVSVLNEYYRNEIEPIA